MRWFLFLGVLVLVSCGGQAPVLEVNQFHLRDTEVPESSLEVEPLEVERLKRLHGAVSEKDRELRKGDYYTVRWNGPTGRADEEIRLVFDYRQAATGHAVRSLEQRFPPAQSGICEFAFTGEQFAQGGRVLAWRVRFFRGNEMVATRRSYLWE